MRHKILLALALLFVVTPVLAGVGLDRAQIYLILRELGIIDAQDKRVTTSASNTLQRAVGQTSAVTSLSATAGATDESYLVSASILITSSSVFNFITTCSYTDETGTPRVATLTFFQTTGTSLTLISNTQGVGAFQGSPIHIRCKAGSSITVVTTGLFTGVTYTIESLLMKVP